MFQYASNTYKHLDAFDPIDVKRVIGMYQGIMSYKTTVSNEQLIDVSVT